MLSIEQQLQKTVTCTRCPSQNVCKENGNSTLGSIQPDHSIDRGDHAVSFNVENVENKTIKNCPHNAKSRIDLPESCQRMIRSVDIFCFTRQKKT